MWINEYFPDIKQFVEKTKCFMMEGSFTNKEVYRLKKIVRKLNSELSNEDNESLIPCFVVVCSCGQGFFFFYLTMCHVNVATLNLNGARDMHKRAELFEIFNQKKSYVTLLQETHTGFNNAADWAVEWNGIAVLSHNTSLSGGVAILFAKSFSPHSYQVEEVIKGRLLKVRAIFLNSIKPKSTYWHLHTTLLGDKFFKESFKKKLGCF